MTDLFLFCSLFL